MNEILYNNLSWDEYLLGDKLGLRYSTDVNSIQNINSLEKRCNAEIDRTIQTQGTTGPIRRFDENRQPSRFDENQQPSRFDENQQPSRFGENRQPSRFGENRQPSRFGENRQSLFANENTPTRECFTSRRSSHCTCGAQNENNTFRSEHVPHSPHCNLRRVIHDQVKMLKQQDPTYEMQADELFIRNDNDMIGSMMSTFGNNKILTVLIIFLSAMCLFQYLNHQEAMDEMNRVMLQIRMIHANPMAQYQNAALPYTHPFATNIY
jgi:hypothetical protein